MDKKNVGVITEQGYVSGNGLGFKPLTEAEKKQLEDKYDEGKHQETK